MERLNPQSHRDAYGRKIDRDHSPALMLGVPWITIILGSLAPMLPVIAPAPVLPPLGYAMLLGWCLWRPGLLPMWAGFPLGLVDDLFSGQPFGSGIVLFSCTMIGLDLLEAHLPWRNFLQNWAIAGLLVTGYLMLAAVLSGAQVSFSQYHVLLPQALLSIVVFPIIVSLVALLDRLRLTRVKRLD